MLYWFASLLLNRAHDGLVSHNVGQVESQEEIDVEGDPLTDLGDGDSGDFGSEVHRDAIDGHKDESDDAKVDDWGC